MLLLPEYLCLNFIKVMTCLLIHYEFTSGVGLDKDVDKEELPDAVPRGEFKPIVLSSGEPTLVAIDLETTDLSKISCPYSFREVGVKSMQIKNIPIVMSK